MNSMVKRINGWTARGDEYGIEGGQSYIKENDCYHVILNTVDRMKEIWNIPAKDWSIEELMCRLEGPKEACKKGPFGRKFLEKYGKLLFQSRLPPK
jgi:hypothetical protein